MTAYEIASKIALNALLDAWARAGDDIAYAKRLGFTVAATSVRHENGRVDLSIVVCDAAGRTSSAPIATVPADVAEDTMAELIALGAS